MKQAASSTAAPSVSLTSILVTNRLLTRDQAQHLDELAARDNIGLAALLEREGVMPRAKQLQVLENHYFCPAIDVRKAAYDAAAVALLPEQIARRHHALVVKLEGETAVVAFAQPDDERAADAIAQAVRRPLRRIVALAEDLDEAIATSYARRTAELGGADAHPGGSAAGTPLRRTAADKAPAAAGTTPAHVHVPSARGSGITPALAGQLAEAPAPSLDCTARLEKHKQNVIALVEDLLSVACEHKATDLHIEPEKNGLAVRLRIDGILHRVAVLPESLSHGVASRIKVIAQMDIAERRLPQDGRFSIQRDTSLIDMRVSSLPAQFGEKLVLRLLEKNMSLLDLDNLAMPAPVRALHQDMIDSPSGFYLVTGPTGSGKTTTLYATLTALDRRSLNVVTLEDPIEYSLPGITQVQINEAAGLTFARCLQSILRQDPDVVLVGEIRNSETVEISCRAALTGHKVFSTLHTNDSTQAVARLLDMGCVPYLITSTLRGVLAQRLLRVICAGCREAYPANATELAILGKDGPLTLHRGRGCSQCAGTGYRGRVALFEYFRLDEKYHHLVLERSSSYAMRQAAQRDGMITMAESAKQAVLDGVSTVAEIERCVLSDHGRERLCSGCHRVVSIDYSVCPYCKTVLRENCPHCSHPVEPNWEVCATCGREIEREWRRSYCPRCDAPQDARWSNCPYCGCDVG